MSKPVYLSVELPSDAMQMSNGDSFFGVNVNGEWGVAYGVSNEGPEILRVFDLTSKELEGLNHKTLASKGTLESITAEGSIDFKMPQGSDTGMAATDVLALLQSGASPNVAASRAVLKQYGFNDGVADHIASRRKFDEVSSSVEKAFGPEGPHAFAGKSSEALVKDNLARALGAESAPSITIPAYDKGHKAPTSHGGHVIRNIAPIG